MNTQSTCPNCGRALAPDAPHGLCPECLMRSGFGTGVAPEQGEETRRPVFTPPSLGEMAKLFPQFEVAELLGQGGMGAVYKARQPALDRWVALKILPPQATGRAGFAQRFNREARALARLSHANIVAVYEFGQAGGMPYFVMEYVEGLTLRRLVQERRLGPRDALRIVPQICEALQFAHDEGVVHRDIKPENILIDKKGRVKIADFGIAKILSEAGEGDAAQAGPAAQAKGDAAAVDANRTTVSLTQDQVLGTPHYMAPEQVEHPQSVDHRADIYSLGVVFYEMLTGELPLGKFQPPSRRAQLDVRLDEVVLHTLEKEPERRYQHASEVKTDVETIARTTTGSTTPSADAPAAARAFEEVRNPASWLLATGILNWIAIPLIVMAAIWVRAQNELSVAPVLLALMAALGLSSFIIFAALKMRRLEAYSAALIACILAMFITPGNIIGLPVGIWSLVALSRREVRQAFGRGYRLEGVAIAGVAPPVSAPDRFWQRFAVAVALVLLALILVPVGIAVLGITLPTIARAKMKARQAASTNLVESVSGNPSAGTPAGGAGVNDNAPIGVMTFGPVMERVLYSVAVQRPIKGEDLDSSREIEVPAEIEKAGEEQFFHWLAAQGVDLLAFAHKQSWDLWAAPKLSSVPSGLWDRPVRSEVMAALESGAVGLMRAEPDAKQGFVSYELGKDVVTPLTFAVQTGAGGVGLLQIAEFTDSPRGIRIRYKLAVSPASSGSTEPASSTSSDPISEPMSRAKLGEFKVTLLNGITLEVAAVGRDPRGEISWWKPDGAPLNEPPVRILELPKLAPTTRPEVTIIPTNEFLVYVRREVPPGMALESFQPAFTPRPTDIEVPATVQDIDGKSQNSAHLVCFTDPPDTVDYYEAVACGPWEAVSIYDVETKSTRDLGRGVMALWSEPRYENGALRFDVMHSADRERHALRMVARLRKGAAESLVFHTGVLAGSPAKGFALIHGREQETRTWLARVKELVIERTPWVRGEIRGIALEPRS